MSGLVRVEGKMRQISSFYKNFFYKKLAAQGRDKLVYKSFYWNSIILWFVLTMCYEQGIVVTSTKVGWGEHGRV